MGKRSQFEKRPRDYYQTPFAAVEPLRGLSGFTYCEPCAGDGRLVEHLEKVIPDALCVYAFDVEPQADWVGKKDALTMTGEDVANCQMIVTNPPYSWNVLKPLMDRWLSLRPTLLLLPADFMHNKRMTSYLDRCRWIKSIGRVKWIEGSKVSGVDNYAWYMFDNNKDVGQPTLFLGRN